MDSGGGYCQGAYRPRCMVLITSDCTACKHIIICESGESASKVPKIAKIDANLRYRNVKHIICWISTSIYCYCY